MKRSHTRSLILLTSIILGFLLASQVSNSKIIPRQIMTFQNYQQVSSEIKKLTDEISLLNAKRKELELNLMQYDFSSQSESKKIEKMAMEISKYEYYNGLTDVTGPGVVVSLSDDPITLDITVPREISSAGTVHDSYIRNVVWDLINGGAEAVSVNGQRVIYKTEFVCEGPVIRINNIGFAPPYRIKAIGDPEALAFILNDADKEYKRIEDLGVIVDFRRENSIVINKYEQNIQPQYMKPVQEEK